MNEAEAILRQTSIRPDRGEDVIPIRQDSTKSHSIDPGIDPLHSDISSAQTPEANDHYVQYTQGFADLASAYNRGVVVLTLGSYGFLLSNPVFWLCWSILVTEAVIFYSIKPYWNWIEDFPRTADQSEHTRKPYRLSDYGRAGALFVKVGMSIALITQLLYSQKITQRQTKILLFVALSIILFEGFTPILIVREELRSLTRNPSDKGKQMIRKIIGHKWKASNFLTPSVINAMIGVTGSTVLGGDLGSLMRGQSFWVFVSIFVVDVLAEASHRFDCGRRSVSVIPEYLPKIHYVAVILRLVEGFLCCWMTKEIYQDSYFPSHVDSNACNGQCQERSKQLLITMVSLGGLQAAGTFIPPLRSLCSCVLGPHYIPTIILSAIVFIGYLPYLVGNLLFCGFVYVNNKLDAVLGRLFAVLGRQQHSAQRVEGILKPHTV